MVRRILKRLAKKLRPPKPMPPPPEPTLQAEAEEEEEDLPNIEVNVKDLLQWREEQHNFQFIDIREVYEMRQGFLPDSWLIPMNKIPDTLDHLPKDKTLVLYCAAGMRSFDVTHFLRQKGFAQTWSLSEGAASFAEHGWIFPEDGSFQLCQSVRFTQDAVQQRNLTNDRGTIQNIQKVDDNIIYAIGQYDQENISIIQNVKPDEIKPA